MMVPLLKPGSWFAQPHPLLAKNREAFARFDQSLPLAEYTFVVCDTELTGLDRKRDEIISIGAVLIRDLQIDLGATFHRYIRPKNIAHTKATLVHRITPQQLLAAPPLEEVLPAFVEFAGASLMVGHCLALDMDFLNRAARKVLGGSLANPGIDTIRMAHGYQRVLSGHFNKEEDRPRSYALEALARKYHLPMFKPHDALEDALQTAYLFLFLLKKFRKGGLTTLKDIYRAGKIGTFWF